MFTGLWISGQNTAPTLKLGPGHRQTARTPSQEGELLPVCPLLLWTTSVLSLHHICTSASAGLCCPLVVQKTSHSFFQSPQQVFKKCLSWCGACAVCKYTVTCTPSEVQQCKRNTAALFCVMQSEEKPPASGCLQVSKYQDIIKALEAVSPGSKCSTYDSLKFLVFLYFYGKLVCIFRIISCVCVYIRGLQNDV